jgi:Flp pilus assembly protein TadG
LRCPTIRSIPAGESGQALVEFALVLPILLLVLFAMLDFGKLFNYWQDATHISAEGARYAAVNRKPDPSDTASLQLQLLGQADTPELRSGDLANGTASASVPAGAQVCISFPNGTSNAGDPVRVTITFAYNWLSFLTSDIGAGLPTSQTVTSSSTMRLEATPTTYSAGCT